MAIKGIFASHSNIVGARRGDFASAILQTNPTGNAPMLALSSGMMSRGLGDTVATWFEENHLSGRIGVTNNASTGTAFTVDDSTQVIAGQIYYVESTGEVVFIEGISSSSATVTRGFGGTTNTALDGSGTTKYMQLIGTASEEGSSKPTAIANLGYPRFNYAQIFRNAWDVTGTAKAVQFHTGDIVAKNKADASLFHAEGIERASFWGVKAMGVMNGQPFRTMDGVKQQIQTNVEVQSGSVKWSNHFRPFFQDIFATNIKGQPNERIAFCGNTVLAVLDDCARLDSQINLVPGATSWGMNIHTFTTPFGTVKLLSHPLFNENPTFTKELVVMHPAAVEYRWLRKTFSDDYDTNGTRLGVDGDFGVITSELTFCYKAEKTAGWFSGIDTAAAST